MPGQTKLDYDQLLAIAKQFSNAAAEVENLLSQTKGKVEALHNNQWMGQAADQFFNQAEGTLLPKMANLVTALQRASEVTGKVSQTIRQADEGTKAFFSGIEGEAADKDHRSPFD